MRIKRLENRITICILIPVFTGMIALVLLSSIYLEDYYLDQINNYREGLLLIKNNVLSNQSQISSISTALYILQIPINLVAIGGALIEMNLLNDSLLIKPSFTGSNNYVSSVLFDENQIIPPGYIFSLNTSFEVAEWYLNQSDYLVLDLPENVKLDLYYSAVYDSVLRPASQVPNIYSAMISGIYLGWNDSGLFYINPTMHLEFDSDYTVYDNCSYFSKYPHYDPRCRPWFIETENALDRSSVILTDPYLYIGNGNQIGETACQGIWNNHSLILVLCADLKIENLNNNLYEDSLGEGQYNYILSADNNRVIYYYNFKNLSQSIQEIEFGDNTDEIKAFNESVLPLFKLNQVSTTEFLKHGVEQLISISPIIINTGLNKKTIHWASFATVIEKSLITSGITSLENYCIKTFFIEGIFILLIMLVILYFFWYLTSRLAKSIVFPIDTLNIVLARLVRQDFAMDLNEKIPQMSNDLNKIFKVFDKLRVILKFKDEKYFKNDANSIINYAQALELFKDFGNQEKIQMCLIEIGNLNIKHGRMQEGVFYLYEALLNFRGTYEEKLNLQVCVANFFLQLKEKINEAEIFFNEAITYYTQLEDYSSLSHTILDYAYGLINLSKNADDLLNKCKMSIGKIANKSDLEIVMQRLLMCEGLVLFGKESYYKAYSKFVLALTDFNHYDPNVRAVCIEKLKNTNIKIIDSNENRNDISLVVQAKFLQISRLFLRMLKNYVNEIDRIAISVIGEKIETLQHLGKDFEEVKFHDNFKDNAQIYDSIFYGIMHLRTQTSEKSNKWVVVICDGQEKASEVPQTKILKALKKYGIGIVFLVFGKIGNEIREIQKNTETGHIFDFNDTSILHNIWEEVIATILPSSYILKI